jgi:hypothetical protein
MKKYNSNCYWCGKPAINMDHCPPKNLFPILDSVNLIKVPSCKKHNNELSELEEKVEYILYQLVRTNYQMNILTIK